MTIHANFDELQRDVTRGAEFYGERRKYAECWGSNLVIASAVCSAATTVLVSASQIFPAGTSALSLAAIVLSSTVSVVTAIEGFFSYRKLAIHYATIETQFYLLLSELRHYRAAANPEQAELDALYEKYQTMLSAATNDWRGIVTRDDAGAPKHTD